MRFRRPNRHDLDDFLAKLRFATLHFRLKFAAFLQESIEDLGLGHVRHTLALDVNDAATIARENRNIRAFRFAGSVHDATHHRDLDREFEFRHQLLLDLFHEREEIDLDAAASGARPT